MKFFKKLTLETSKLDNGDYLRLLMLVIFNLHNQVCVYVNRAVVHMFFQLSGDFSLIVLCQPEITLVRKFKRYVIAAVYYTL